MGINKSIALIWDNSVHFMLEKSVSLANSNSNSACILSRAKFGEVVLDA